VAGVLTEAWSYQVARSSSHPAASGGATLPIGLDRMEGAHPRAYLSAFPSHLAKPNFHAPEAFGSLLLDP